ncbi:MAG: XTP/dITP diphosphatase [Dehalococcoidia bacterium]|nr:XTP/dITP diphosphatase [Dehalococcoidia bacterium]
MRPKLLIATNNAGKLREYRSLLEGMPFDLVSPADAGIKADVAETGKTFEENARLKALAFASLSKLLTLADDSGLEVDALASEPGVRSARYAGENATDADRISYLLVKLKNVPREKRSARFRCVIAIAKPDGWITTCEGECAGYITLEPRGTCGFGYDPVFYFPELGKTMAELVPEVKNRVSHRARAAAKAREILLKIARESVI